MRFNKHFSNVVTLCRPLDKGLKGLTGYSLLRSLGVALLLLFCAVTLSYAYHLPDTGQTKCYDSSGAEASCEGTGQDGAYTINPMNYTDNGDGTVTDNVTGLMWQKQDDGVIRSRSAAEAYCLNLRVGAYSDWKLPLWHI